MLYIPVFVLLVGISPEFHPTKFGETMMTTLFRRILVGFIGVLTALTILTMAFDWMVGR